jgi:hypothetical protein
LIMDGVIGASQETNRAGSANSDIGWPHGFWYTGVQDV